MSKKAKDTTFIFSALSNGVADFRIMFNGEVYGVQKKVHYRNCFFAKKEKWVDFTKLNYVNRKFVRRVFLSYEDATEAIKDYITEYKKNNEKFWKPLM